MLFSPTKKKNAVYLMYKNIYIFNIEVFFFFFGENIYQEHEKSTPHTYFIYFMFYYAYTEFSSFFFLLNLRKEKKNRINFDISINKIEILFLFFPNKEQFSIIYY